MIGPLPGRSLTELATRARQAVAARLGRLGIEPRLRPTAAWLQSLERPIRSADELLDWLRSQAPGLAPPGASEPAATAAAVESAHPGGTDRLRSRAEAVSNGRFDVLGYRDLSFGDPVDWSLDPTTGVRAPAVHWSKIDNLDASQVGDHKVIWELNRQQYLSVLARAALLTGENRYARLALAHMDAWGRANPPQVGVNWSSSLELAYRSIAWLWTLLWLRDEPLDADVVARSLQLLELHGHHIETHLSTFYSPNTHLTGEALGLLYLGTLLPILPAAERWRRVGWDTLVSELDRHVVPDGTYFERATYYHRYTVDIYTHALVLGTAQSDRDRSAIRGALNRLLDHALAVTRPDGGTPLVGDDDGGHLWMPRHDRPGDFRPSLSNGAVLLGRDDLAHVAGGLDPETLWLLGPAAADEWAALDPTPPGTRTMVFPEGGYFVLRDGWSPESRYMLFDAGPHGALNCGHAHADALSFELSAGGAPLLVDPGTFSYADPGARNAFRGAGVHNTITLEGEGASIPAGPFQWARIADVGGVRWTSGAEFDYVDGAVELPAPGSRHRREVLFARGAGWLLRDRVEGEPGAAARAVFQGAPGTMSPQRDAGESAGVRFRAVEGGWPLDIRSWGGDLTGRVESRWVSPTYGKRTQAPAWVLESPVGQDLVTLLIPAPEDHPALDVRTQRAGTALHLRFHVGQAEHEVWCGDGSGTAIKGLRSDARSVWRIAEGPIVRLIAIDASWLELEGKRYPVEQGTTGPCTEARRAHGDWTFMTGDS